MPARLAACLTTSQITFGGHDVAPHLARLVDGPEHATLGDPGGDRPGVDRRLHPDGIGTVRRKQNRWQFVATGEMVVSKAR